MQKVIIPREIQEISRVLFGNLPTTSLAKSGLKPYNRRPLATPMELTNPRSIHEILKAPLQFPTDDLILNGYTPYQWMRYSEKISDPFAKKQAGQLVDEEEQFYYRFAKTRRYVNGQVTSAYKTDQADYWEKFANPYRAAELGYVDEIIEPSITRSRLIRSFELLANKRQSNPPKKHSNIPL